MQVFLHKNTEFAKAHRNLGAFFAAVRQKTLSPIKRGF
jgi:hypothetical protein